MIQLVLRGSPDCFEFTSLIMMLRFNHDGKIPNDGVGRVDKLKSWQASRLRRSSLVR